MNEIGKYCLLCDIVSYLESWYVVRDIICAEHHEICGSNAVQLINQSPAAISSSTAARRIYILSIYIQMKMVCLVMEIGIQTQIMPPRHSVEMYDSIQSGLLDPYNSHVRIEINVLYKNIQDFHDTYRSYYSNPSCFYIHYYDSVDKVQYNFS